MPTNILEKLRKHLEESNIRNNRNKKNKAIEEIGDNPKMITSLTDLSAFIKNRGFTNDYYKKELVIKIIEDKSEIITGPINSTKLSTFAKMISWISPHTTGLTKLLNFITGLGFEDNNHKIDLAIKIIEKNPNIIKNSKELSTFITELGFEDDIHKQYLAIKIIEKNPKIIKDLKNLQELSTFITELDFKDNNHKKALVIKIIEKNPKIIKDLKNLQELSTFITKLGFKDNNHKIDLAIKIIEKNPNIIKDSKELSKWINLVNSTPNNHISSPYTKNKILVNSNKNK